MLSHKAAAVLLHLAALALAQGNNADFPDLAANTVVLGASTSSSSSSATPTTTPTPTSTRAPIGTDSPTAFPTLAGVGVPPLIIPDTSGAAFMQHSTLPEGTVFICVGAILGALGACVLAWNATIAWSIRRSVKNAAKSHGPDGKSIFGASSEPAYQSMYATSNVSLDNLAKTKTSYAGGGGGAHARGASRNPKTASNLFFSPTANTSTPTSARHSTHLPPGYYASGSAQPAGGSGLAAFGGPASSGYGRMPSMDGLSNPPSRPVSRHNSPGVEQRRSRLGPGGAPAPPAHSAQSSFSGPDGMLETPGAQARTPSAYLEDLFSEHGYGPGERR